MFLILQNPLFKYLIYIVCQLHTASDVMDFSPEGTWGRSRKLHPHSVINVGLNFPARCMYYFWCWGVYVCYHVDDTLVLMRKASAR